MPDSLPLRLQSLLGTAYALRRELTGGGMSRAFVAFEPALKREVVVKVLPPDLRSATSLARFNREIEVTARLQHPHILPVLTTGGDDQLLYYVMPYVVSGSIRDRLRSAGPLRFAHATSIAGELLAALAFAHDRGVVHRDIKPGNVLLSEGHAILADFGIASLVEAAQEAETRGATSVASPAYLAPERPRDAAADLYAVAVLTYEMLTGSPPVNRSAAAITASLLDSQPDAPPERVRAVGRVLATALAHDPALRYTGASDLRSALADPNAGRRPRPLALARAGTAVAATLLVTWLAARSGAMDADGAAPPDTAVTSPALPSTGVASELSAPSYVVEPSAGPAQHALARAPRGSERTDLAGALLDEALRHAWSSSLVDREDATRAAARALATAGLDARESLLSRGVAALGRREFRRACDAFDSAVVMRPDYHAWMGAGECRYRDTTVVVEADGVARFRSSYYQAALAFVEAARLAPAGHTLAYDRLTAVAFTEPARVRTGWAADGRMYLGQPVAVGDTFTFEAFTLGPRSLTTDFVSANLVAMEITRGMLRPAFAARVRHNPDDPSARLRLVELLEAAGNIREPGRDGLTALAEVVEARARVGEGSHGLRLAHTHVRLLLRSREFHEAARLSDSLLAAVPNPSAGDAELLLSLAMLLGRPSRAVPLLEVVSGAPSRRVRLPDGRPVAIPPVMIRERASFVVAAALGTCDEDVRTAPARLASALAALFPGRSIPPGVEGAFLERPLLLAVPCVGPEGARVVKEPSNPLSRALLAPSEAARAEWMARYESVRALRATGAMYESTESGLAEALVHLAGTDTLFARATLRQVLGALPALPSSFLNNEVQAGTLPRAMALAAELAWKAGDADEAARWSSAVLALWTDADPALQPVVAQMLTLRTWPQIRSFPSRARAATAPGPGSPPTARAPAPAKASARTPRTRRSRPRYRRHDPAATSRDVCVARPHPPSWPRAAPTVPRT